MTLAVPFPPATLKIKVLPAINSEIVATNGLQANKENGVVTIEPDYGALAVQTSVVDADREVLFIWGRPGHPAAPATAEALAVANPPVEAPKPATPKPAAPKPRPKPAPKPAESPAETPPAATPDSAPSSESPAPPAPTATTPEAPAT